MLLDFLLDDGEHWLAFLCPELFVSLAGAVIGLLVGLVHLLDRLLVPAVRLERHISHWDEGNGDRLFFLNKVIN